MNRKTLERFVQNKRLSRPAVFTNAAGVQRSTRIVFEEEGAQAGIGMTDVQSENLSCWGLTGMLFDADSRCTISIGTTLENEEGKTLTLNGEELELPGVLQLKVRDVSHDGEGMTRLTLVKA